MADVTLVAGALAALAIIVLVIRMLFLIRRVQQVWERIDRTLESELSPGIREWGEAARGIREATGNLHEGISSLGRTLERVDQFTEKLEPELVAHLLTGPLARLASWVAGVSRGMKAQTHKDTRGRSRPPRSKGEAEPGN
jgi:hypothetical protein